MAIITTARNAILDRHERRCYGFAPRRRGSMRKTRAFLAALATLLVAELLAIAIHGFVLAPDYAPYYGTLLRGGDSPSWQLAFLTVAHASYVAGLVWIYLHVSFAGPRLTQGLKLGLVGWVVGQVPLWLLWF